MIIQCEQCKTRFRVGDDKLKAGSIRVRCSKCAHVFVAHAEAPDASGRAGMFATGTTGSLPLSAMQPAVPPPSPPAMPAPPMVSAPPMTSHAMPTMPPVFATAPAIPLPGPGRVDPFAAKPADPFAALKQPFPGSVNSAPSASLPPTVVHPLGQAPHPFASPPAFAAQPFAAPPRDPFAAINTGVTPASMPHSQFPGGAPGGREFPGVVPTPMGPTGRASAAFAPMPPAPGPSPFGGNPFGGLPAPPITNPFAQAAAPTPAPPAAAPAFGLVAEASTASVPDWLDSRSSAAPSAPQALPLPELPQPAAAHAFLEAERDPFDDVAISTGNADAKFGAAFGDDGGDEGTGSADTPSEVDFGSFDDVDREKSATGRSERIGAAFDFDEGPAERPVAADKPPPPPPKPAPLPKAEPEPEAPPARTLTRRLVTWGKSAEALLALQLGFFACAVGVAAVVGHGLHAEYLLRADLRAAVVGDVTYFGDLRCHDVTTSVRTTHAGATVGVVTGHVTNTGASTVGAVRVDVEVEGAPGAIGYVKSQISALDVDDLTDATTLRLLSASARANRALSPGETAEFTVLVWKPAPGAPVTVQLTPLPVGNANNG